MTHGTHGMSMQGNIGMDMGQQGHAGSTERPMSHHMVVFGHETVFMSHLSMFSVPEHAYQVILQAELTGADSDPQKIFQQDWAAHPDVAFYTFAPKPFVLSDLLATAGQPPKVTTFSGDLWRNHLEQPETHPVKIASHVTVNVKNIVHGRRFDLDAAPLTALEYILFGRSQEVYLAHLITHPPDFDQLLRVTISPAFSDDELSGGHIVTVDGHENTENQRIEPSGQASVAATVNTGTPPVNVQIDPTGEVYFNDDSDMQAQEDGTN
jgi:hypothetical protein